MACIIAASIAFYLAGLFYHRGDAGELLMVGVLLLAGAARFAGLGRT